MGRTNNLCRGRKSFVSASDGCLLQKQHDSNNEKIISDWIMYGGVEVIAACLETVYTELVIGS
jgi:hypothetical protein